MHATASKNIAVITTYLDSYIFTEVIRGIVCLSRAPSGPIAVNSRAYAGDLLPADASWMRTAIGIMESSHIRVMPAGMEKGMSGRLKTFFIFAEM